MASRSVEVLLAVEQKVHITMDDSLIEDSEEHCGFSEMLENIARKCNSLEYFVELLGESGIDCSVPEELEKKKEIIILDLD